VTFNFAIEAQKLPQIPRLDAALQELATAPADNRPKD
jgi:hypothetical protein